MDMSVKGAIARTRAEFKLQSQDSLGEIADRMIMSELQSTALKYIKQSTDKRRLWNSSNIFTVLPCLKLQQVPLSDCCAYNKKCTISRSVVKLPRIAEGTNFGMLVQGIWAIDIVSRRFIESTPDRYRNSLSLGLGTNQLHFWIQDGYLYIGSESITQVKMAAYFEEDIPDELIYYPDYCASTTRVVTTGCCAQSQENPLTVVNDADLCCPPNPYDLTFRCPGYMVDDVMKEVANKLLATFKRSSDDHILPGKDNSK